VAGLNVDTPIPSEVILHGRSRALELRYADGRAFRIPFELLRVYSPSAEVRGHGPGQETPQTGKREVTVVALEPVGNYALQPTFSDGHNSGLYSWDHLYDLAVRGDLLWQAYLDQLARAGLERDAPMASSQLDKQSALHGGKAR
jgi:DUF971 family protein